MSHFRLSCLCILFVLGLLTAPARAAAQGPVTFTGDVDVDFPATDRYPDRGGAGDVGIPGAAPAGTSIGWDFIEVGVSYDPFNDILYIGANMAGGAISGDADGDGDPGNTAAWLAGLQGTDFPDLGGDEAIDILIDIDQSCELGSSTAADYEIVAGVPLTGDTGAFSVRDFSKNPSDLTRPGAGYSGNTYSGTLFASPSAAQPDLEFTIENFCVDVLGACANGPELVSFAFRARAGSGSDDGVGEDAIACTDVSITSLAIGLQTVTADPQPDSPGLLLALLGGSLIMTTGWLSRRRERRIGNSEG